jgi:hypothetical protein
MYVPQPSHCRTTRIAGSTLQRQRPAAEYPAMPVRKCHCGLYCSNRRLHFDAASTVSPLLRTPRGLQPSSMLVRLRADDAEGAPLRLPLESLTTNFTASNEPPFGLAWSITSNAPRAANKDSPARFRPRCCSLPPSPAVRVGLYVGCLCRQGMLGPVYPRCTPEVRQRSEA